MSLSNYFKPVDQLTFADNFVFQTVLRDKEICREFVERLLHIKIKNIEYPELEKSIAPFYSTKGIRLDVYLKDQDKIIDVEMQSYQQSALGKRSRYYQSMIDMDSLMKGQDYTELKDSYILFICTQDPFKASENKKSIGLPCYTFKSSCLESEEVKLNDNCVKVIYNASAYREEKDPLVRNILQFISTNRPGEDDFANRLSTLVETLKDRESFRQEYAAMNIHDRDLIRIARQEGINQGIEQGIEKGIEKGMAVKALESAVTAVREFNLAPETVAEKMKVPLEDLLEALKN
ncbi:MAG: Rpn family recombination-promoting nuclease/putative transposase [Treponema sp.]|nr:Rpn family recombination-promoting nuclease/putative transposase [Treponema sp.]